MAKLENYEYINIYVTQSAEVTVPCFCLYASD